MNTTKKLSMIDGTEYLGSKSAIKKQVKYRRKKFVRVVKRSMAGPFLGSLLAFLAFQIIQVPLVFCVIGGLAITSAGLFLRFRYVKHVYLGLVILLYAYLIGQMILH